MKKTLSLLLALLTLLSLIGTVCAEAEITPGVYTLKSYEVGTMTMDGSMMPNTSLTVNADGTGTFIVQGGESPITYAAGTISIADHPTYTYEVVDSANVRINMFDVMYLNMTASLEAAPATAAPIPTVETSLVAETPAPTAVPAATPTPDGSGVKLNFADISGVDSIVLYRGSTGDRDGVWNKIGEIDARSTSVTDNTPVSSEPYYKLTFTFKDRTEEYIYYGSEKQQLWTINTANDITSGYDFVQRIAYTYVYQKGVFSYREKTYENLVEGVDYTWDDESSKIQTATTTAVTLAKNYDDVIGMSFDFELTKVISGNPFGKWRLFVRLYGGKKTWREAKTFTVKDGNCITVNSRFKSAFSINKVAWIGPRAAYSIQKRVNLNSITVKDPTY